jgi:hypothetical protein
MEDHMADVQLFYTPAKNYLEAVKVIAGSAMDEAHRFLPMHNLMGFAMELYLKAWLSHAGLTKKQLGAKHYGHHLKNLFAEAKSADIPSINGLEPLIDHLHGPHHKLQYRYLDADMTFMLTAMDVVIPIFDELDLSVLAIVPPMPKA